MHRALLQWLWETKSFFCYWPWIETGKAIIGEIVPQALKSYQHEGWIGLGDTYGPMHYPGMRSLWQSPANFHQHLAFPSPPSPGPPTWFSFLLLHFLLPIQTLCACYLPRMATINRKKKKQKKTASVLSSKYGRSWWCAIILYCFPSWWDWLLILLGEKISFTMVCWCRPKTTEYICLKLWKYRLVRCTVWAKRHSGKV